jgi:hypothetical protein
MADMNRNPNNRRYEADTNYTPWVIGALVVIALIIGGVIYANKDNRTAANSGPNTTTSAPANTTGTGPGRPAAPVPSSNPSR